MVEKPDLLSYAEARITSLIQQRDVERQTFRQTQRLLESQVRLLEAQVARRDATVAACRNHTGNKTIEEDEEHIHGTRPGDVGASIPLSDEQITQTLRKTLETNHTLETEIRMLSQKVISYLEIHRFI